MPCGARVSRLSMYGVVVCPRCKRAKGVNLKQKTTTCQCGFEIYVVPARVRARAETARELAPLVGQVSAEIAGGTEAYRRAVRPAGRDHPEIFPFAVSASPAKPATARGLCHPPA